MKYFCLCALLLLISTPAIAQQREKADSVRAGSRSPDISRSGNLILLPRMATSNPYRQSLVPLDSASLESLLEDYPSLRRAVLYEMLTTLPAPDEWAVAQDSLTKQLFRYTRLTEFEQMSLAAQRQQELFGNQTELRNRFYQTDIIKLVQWIISLFQ